MTPAQIKIGVYGGALLLAWWLADRSAKPKQERIVKTLDVEANVLNKNFGLTDAEIAAQGSASNPGVNPDVREAIDRSNAIISADDMAGDNQ